MAFAPTDLREIVVHCIAAGAPLRDAWVSVTMPVCSKNPHRLLFGPSNEDGAIVVSIEQIRAEISQDQDAHPMDYSGDVDWNGTIWVRLLDEAAAVRAVEAADLWSLERVYPGRRDQLAAFASVIRNATDAFVQVFVVPDGSGDVRVSDAGPDAETY